MVVSSALAEELRTDETFRIGYFELAPHIVEGPDGQLHGPALDYAQRILQRMGNPRHELKGYPVRRALQMLQLGEIDMVLFAAKTPVTSHSSFVMTKRNIVVLHPAVVVKNESVLRAPLAAQDLLNTNLAYWSGGHVPELLKHPNIKLVKVSGERVYDRGIRMVKMARADAFFHVDGLALEWWLKNRYDGQDLRLVRMPMQVEAKSLFSRASAERYQQAYEAALHEQQQQQSYSNFFLNYPFDDSEMFKQH